MRGSKKLLTFASVGAERHQQPHSSDIHAANPRNLSVRSPPNLHCGGARLALKNKNLMKAFWSCNLPSPPSPPNVLVYWETKEGPVYFLLASDAVSVDDEGEVDVAA